MFTKISEFFRKNYFKIFKFLEPLYISREISDEIYYRVEKYIKKAQKWLRLKRNIGNGMKILENFGENRLEFVENFKIINI